MDSSLTRNVKILRQRANSADGCENPQKTIRNALKKRKILEKEVSFFRIFLSPQCNEFRFLNYRLLDTDMVSII